MAEDLWTTAGVAEGPLRHFWRDCMQRAMPGFDVETGSAFSGTVRRRLIGRLQINRITVGGILNLRRTSAEVARCEQQRFVLLRIRSGQGWLRHAGAEIPLQSDDCVLLDTREPQELSLESGADTLWFHLPVEWVERHMPDPQAAVGVVLGKQQPWVDGLRDVMESIHRDQEAVSPFLLSENLCTALALAAEAIEVRSTRHVRKTFISLQRTLAELAFTCNVTAGEIALAHGISLRYLHAIYSANGTSCGRELIRVRLERARRLLLDPAEQDRSIDDIAWQCGFSEASHFRRRFRTFFGVPPSAMRCDGGRRSTETVLPGHLRIA